MNAKQRIGKFKISRNLIQDWERMLPVMGRFFVVRAELLYAEDCIDYTAFSPLFDEVESGVAAPEYQLIWNTDCGPLIARRL